MPSGASRRNFASTTRRAERPTRKGSENKMENDDQPRELALVQDHDCPLCHAKLIAGCMACEFNVTLAAHPRDAALILSKAVRESDALTIARRLCSRHYGRLAAQVDAAQGVA